MIITYNLKPFLKKDLGSFGKSYIKLKLWVVKLLKLNIEKSWFDYQDTKCCSLAIQYILPKLLPGPNPYIRFMKNSVHMSLLGSLTLPNRFWWHHWVCVLWHIMMWRWKIPSFMLYIMLLEYIGSSFALIVVLETIVFSI